MWCSLILVMLSCLTAVVHANDRKVNIAVIDFNTNCFSKNDIVGLTNRLNLEIFNTGRYNIIERSMIEEILKEQGFQQSGCTNTQCAVEIGQLIGVEKICIGSFDRVGSYTSSNARIVNVATGKVEKMVSVDCERCDVGYVFRSSIPELARRLVADPSPRPISQPDPRPASQTVSTVNADSVVEDNAPEQLPPPEESSRIGDIVDNEARGINPDGYCGSLNAVFFLGYNLQKHRAEIDYGYYGYTDKHEVDFHYFVINYAAIIPSAPTFSMFISSRFNFGENLSIQLALAPRFFTKTVESLSELENPDGKIGTTILSPVFGINFNKDRMSTFQMGGGLGYVVTNVLTISGDLSYLRYTEAETNGFCFSLSPLIHFPKSASSGKNPDGSFKSFHMQPQYFLTIVEDGSYHEFGLSLTVPFNQSTTGFVSIGWGGGNESSEDMEAESRGFIISTGVSLFTK